MIKVNIKQFIALMDSAQDEDTEMVINVGGEEIAVGILEEAQKSKQHTRDSISRLGI